MGLLTAFPPSVRLTGLEPRVTDHALVRYMERAQGFDLEALRASLLTPERCAAILAGARRIHLPAEGVTLMVRGTAITTVLPFQRTLELTR